MPEEVASTTAAVNATAGQVVLYQGKVASTYYHSTSGGRTAAIEDVWPGETPVPYLVSVPDPYDNASPYHDWGPVVVKRERLAKLLKVQGPLMDATAVVNALAARHERDGRWPQRSCGADRCHRRSAPPSTCARPGSRSACSRSSARPAPVPFGKKLDLGALARGLGKVTVEQRVAGERSWSPFSTLASRADGVLSIPVKPKVTTAFRLVTDTATSAPVRVHRLAAPAHLDGARRIGARGACTTRSGG